MTGFHYSKRLHYTSNYFFDSIRAVPSTTTQLALAAELRVIGATTPPHYRKIVTRIIDPENAHLFLPVHIPMLLTFFKGYSTWPGFCCPHHD